MPCGVGPARGALLPHHFTLTAPRAKTRSEGWRYLSVALSVGLRRPGVTWHLALWSPDFPRRAYARRDCPADSAGALYAGYHACELCGECLLADCAAPMRSPSFARRGTPASVFGNTFCKNRKICVRTSITSTATRRSTAWWAGMWIGRIRRCTRMRRPLGDIQRGDQQAGRKPPCLRKLSRVSQPLRSARCWTTSLHRNCCRRRYGRSPENRWSP